jgi:uncharacterized protein YbbC (DUF1343 family)
MSPDKKGRVILGCENFFADHLDIVKNKKVGLITNQTGVDHELRSLIDLFHKNPFIDLVALYAPEHGIRGNIPAGQTIPFCKDEKYDLPIYSLYGQHIYPDLRKNRDFDAEMRSFDTNDTGKMPDDSMVENVDVMVFDIQDIGTRIFTYTATMAYCMQVCAKAGIKFIVLDRPNPINGQDLEGPILDYPQYSSFVGLYPIPVRHGMTIGELSQLFNSRYLPEKVDLTVIPMRGWSRAMWYDQIGLPWVYPSPNIPTMQTATVYPGQVFLEGTNISEGRGTTKPFELFGAPWITGQDLVDELNMLALPGVKFREAWFLPVISKYKGQLCSGAQIHVVDREIFMPFNTTIFIIQTIQKMYPEKFRFHSHYFDLIIGSSSVRQSIEKDIPVDEITKKYSSQIDEFSHQRTSYLLYQSSV